MGWELFLFFFGPSMATSSSDGISILLPKFISLMTASETFFAFWVGIIKQIVFSICLVFILLLKGLFSSNTSSPKSIRSFFFCCYSVAASSIALNFCSRSKNSLSSFFLFLLFQHPELVVQGRDVQCFLCLRGLNKSSTSSSSNWSGRSKKSCSSLVNLKVTFIIFFFFSFSVQ